jgi:hypothetical protein
MWDDMGGYEVSCHTPFFNDNFSTYPTGQSRDHGDLSRRDRFSTTASSHPLLEESRRDHVLSRREASL